MSTLYTFIRRHGYSPKYSKHAIFNRSKRMLVNNLVANRHPALPHEERSAIRALVHRTVVQLEASGEPAIAGSMPTVLGKLGKLKRFHGRTGVQLGVPLVTPLEILQAGDSSIAIAAGVIAVIVFVWRWRRNAIESLRKDLALVWTNEGDILSPETNFIDLSLKGERGDLFGSLSSPQTNDIFDIHVTPGWFWANANITLLRGRNSLPVAEVKLTLKGNLNRLYWVIQSKDAPLFLPRKSLLWPSPIQ
jgi:hypothetical protein